MQIQGYLQTIRIPDSKNVYDLMELLRASYGGGRYRLQLMEKSGNGQRFSKAFATIEISGIPLLDGRPWSPHGVYPSSIPPPASSPGTPVIVQQPVAQDGSFQAQLLALLAKAYQGQHQEDTPRLIQSLMGVIQPNPMSQMQQWMEFMMSMRKMWGDSDRGGRSNRQDREPEKKTDMWERMGEAFMMKMMGMPQAMPAQTFSPPRFVPSPFQPPPGGRPGDVWHPERGWIPYPPSQSSTPPPANIADTPPATQLSLASPSTSPSDFSGSPSGSPGAGSPVSSNPSRHESDDEDEDPPMTPEELAEEALAMSDDEKQKFMEIVLSRMGVSPETLLSQGGAHGHAAAHDAADHGSNGNPGGFYPNFTRVGG